MWLPDARQYFARFEIGGITVDVSTVEWPAAADTFECAGVGPWKHYQDVPFAGRLIPAVRLELRLVSELVRGRPDRSTPILEHLRWHGCDRDLVLRSMRDRGLNPTLRTRVIDQLR